MSHHICIYTINEIKSVNCYERNIFLKENEFYYQNLINIHDFFIFRFLLYMEYLHKVIRLLY